MGNESKAVGRHMAMTGKLCISVVATAATGCKSPPTDFDEFRFAEVKVDDMNRSPELITVWSKCEHQS